MKWVPVYHENVNCICVICQVTSKSFTSSLLSYQACWFLCVFDLKCGPCYQAICTTGKWLGKQDENGILGLRQHLILFLLRKYYCKNTFSRTNADNLDKGSHRRSGLLHCAVCQLRDCRESSLSPIHSPRQSTMPAQQPCAPARHRARRAQGSTAFFSPAYTFCLYQTELLEVLEALSGSH